MALYKVLSISNMFPRLSILLYTLQGRSSSVLAASGFALILFVVAFPVEEKSKWRHLALAVVIDAPGEARAVKGLEPGVEEGEQEL